MRAYEELYARAQCLSTSASPPDLRELGDKISRAADAMATKLCVGLVERVEAAAIVGSKQLDLVRFQGNELEEGSGFPMLTLVKGPRDQELKILGGATLIQRLRAKLAPFQVHHVWNSRSNSNRIVISWGEEVQTSSEPEGAHLDRPQYPLPPIPPRARGAPPEQHAQHL